MIRPWLVLLAAYDEDQLAEQTCLIVGAVLCMDQKPGAKRRGLEQLLVALREDPRPPEEWMVIRSGRGAPQVVEPPLKINISSKSTVSRVIFDPLTLLERLQAAATPAV